MPNRGQMFTVASAAAACLVDQKTIRRRLEQLKEHGAARGTDGQWAIPLEALLAAGLKPGRPAAPDSPPVQNQVSRGAVHGQDERWTPTPRVSTAAAVTGHAASGEVLAELVELRRQTEMDDLRRRAEVAEARLEEQTRLLAERAEVVEVLRMALRQLEVAPTPLVTASPPPAEPAAATPAPAAAVPASPGGASEPAVQPASRRRWWQSRR